MALLALRSLLGLSKAAIVKATYEWQSFVSKAGVHKFSTNLASTSKPLVPDTNIRYHHKKISHPGSLTHGVGNIEQDMFHKCEILFWACFLRVNVPHYVIDG
jgi:hypothetical protein